MEGKAKEAFEKWFEKEYGTFTTFYAENVDKINNHMIVEWLDSVGIHITVSYWIVANKWQDLILGVYNGSFKHNTRQEAIEAAIKKAVKIYNEKHNENEQ